MVDTAGGTCSTVLPHLLSSVQVEMLNVNARLTPDQPTGPPNDAPTRCAGSA